MWNKQLRRETKENMRKKWVIIGVIAVVLLALLIGLGIYNTPASRLSRQLDLGKRYLEELNYEQAVVAFNVAIEIDPRSADAYLGLADAYIGLGDEEAAYAALQAGYEATGDERIKARMEEMEADMTESEPEILSPAEENDVISDRVDEIYDTIYDQGGPNQHSSDGSSHLLTYEQIEAAYRPLVEELELYLEQEEGNWEELDWTLWMCLADSYLHLGEMEKCMETRRKGYEITGWQRLAPDASEDENGNAFDAYGRLIKDSGGCTYVYGEADRCITYEWPPDRDDGFDKIHYEYDEFGRIARTSQIVKEGYIGGPDPVFDYQVGDAVIIKSADPDDSVSPMTLITYNEYGIHLGRTDAADTH